MATPLKHLPLARACDSSAARFVIGQDGVIAFANVAVDYDQRSEPTSILPVLRELGFIEKSRGDSVRQRISEISRPQGLRDPRKRPTL